MNKVLSVGLIILCGAWASCPAAEFALKAAQRPLGFAVVREDSHQDLELINRYFKDESISMLMVASGGCTAAHLIAHARLHDLTLVDPNKAQLALSKLKTHLLALPMQKRAELLGHSYLDPATRKSCMQGLLYSLDIDGEIFGNLDEVAKCGLDHTGRYELVFEELRKRLVPHAEALEQLFQYDSVQDQIKHLAPDSPLGKALDEALDDVMSQANLVAIFGEKATANRVQDFSSHFAQRIRLYISKNLASSSPWLAYMLLGRFYKNEQFPWLTAKAGNTLPELSFYHGYMNEVLEKSESEKYHVIHLSNIIDWLSPQEAQKTLRLAYRALKPGGIVLIRQLNSNVDIVKLAEEFTFDAHLNAEFLENDRSFFYRNFLVGFKPKQSKAPRVQALADEVLSQMPIAGGSFFKAMDFMEKRTFQKVQAQFFHAVDYFSRPMAALIARLPLHHDRIDILHNIVEEHGDFQIERYHSNTFRAFLQTIDAEDSLKTLTPSPVVTMFNYTLMGTCSQTVSEAIACMGIIEYAFADISAFIAKKVVERGWVNKEDLVHYNLHAAIDKQHAEDFFKIVEPLMDDEAERVKIQLGLKLGAYIFLRLYEDLYQQAAG